MLLKLYLSCLFLFALPCVLSCSVGHGDDSAVELSEEATPQDESVATSAADEQPTASTTPDPTVEASAPNPQQHIVESGDTLWGLSIAYGCSVMEIKIANGLDAETIFPGQALSIPVCDEKSEPSESGSDVNSGEYVVEAGDYLEMIAAQVGCSTPDLMAANSLSNDVIFAGQTLAIPDCADASANDPASTETQQVDEVGIYVVQPGDYLGLIASRHGCSVAELMEASELASDRIGVGARLRIPECDGQSGLYAGFDPSSSGGSSASFTQDGSSLDSLMRERGISIPTHFKAYVVEFTFNGDRSEVARERRFNYNGTADDVAGWNPASTVKLFAGVAALERAESMGFTRDVEITFHGTQPHTTTLKELLREALGPSNNIAYDFLAIFTGHDRLNRQFLSEANGFHHSALRRAYARSTWMEMGWSASFASSPQMTLREGGKTETIPASTGSYDTGCHASACTSLQDLSELMRRLMLHEQLPSSQQFDISIDGIRAVRRTLRTDRRRGEEVVDNLANAWPSENVRFYHKAGYSGQWFSDVVYIYDPSATQAWIVALAGYPGRESLSSTARAIGEIVASGELARIR